MLAHLPLAIRTGLVGVAWEPPEAVPHMCMPERMACAAAMACMATRLVPAWVACATIASSGTALCATTATHEA